MSNTNQPQKRDSHSALAPSGGAGAALPEAQTATKQARHTPGPVHGNRYYIVAKSDVLRGGKVWNAGDMVLTRTGKPRSFMTHGLALAFKSSHDYSCQFFRIAYGWDLIEGVAS